jgi:iron complex outermembrane receptor protein
VQVLNVSGSQSLDAILHLPAGQHLWFDASWTHLQPERGNVEEAFTKYATDALKEQVILGLRVDLKERISASINGRYLQRINSGDYTLLDIHLQYNLNTWQVFADVNNLLDTDYTEVGTVPLPGRWISAGLRFKGLY